MLGLTSDVSSYSSYASAMSTVQYRPKSSHVDPSIRMQNDDCDGETLAARYQMLEELGSGSFGTVYKAIEKATGEIVAVKHVDLESSEEDLSDILSELSVLSSCASSHVTKYKLAFLRRQTLWIVMEYLGGGSCADLLKPPPHCLPEQHIAIICRELLIGLDYLHREGKLHRDIKAANVLLGRDGRVKLADFGVAAQLVGLKSLRNTFVGTPFWMAPEVIQQEGHDSKADVWSLGITAMELANGEPPHANVHPMKVLFQIPKQNAPRLEGGNWSKEFRDFIAHCLTKDPDRRSSAKELLKHKFVKNAGKTEALQELILRKQDWDANKGSEKHLKYYAETLRTLEVADGDDDWDFGTIKPLPISNMGTSRKTRPSIDPFEDDSPTRMERGVVDQMEIGTMRRVAEMEKQVEENSRSPGHQQNTKKRLSSVPPRPPLGVNMSFGNSPSTVRQFKRTSSHEESKKLLTDEENNNEEPDTGSVIRTPQKQKPHVQHLQVVSNPFNSNRDAEMMPPPPTPSPTKRLSQLPSASPSKASRFSTASTLADATRQASSSSTASESSKEAILGRRLYSKAIGISCQEVLDNTADARRREAVARLAEAFSDLEAADPEGIYHIMSSMFTRVKDDAKMMSLIPPLAGFNQVALPATGDRISSVASTTSVASSVSPRKLATTAAAAPRGPNSRLTTPISSPSKASTTAAAGAGAGAGAKLVLAQNNPHLKSHHRRQSSQSPTRPSASTTPVSSAPSSPTPSRSPSKVSALAREELLKRRGSQLAPSSSCTSSTTSTPASAITTSAGGSPRKGAQGQQGQTQSQQARQERIKNRSQQQLEQQQQKKERAKERQEKEKKQQQQEQEIEAVKIKVGGQMEHTAALAEGMFARWCEGVAVRWAGVQ